MQVWKGNTNPGKLTAEPNISISGTELNTVQVSSFGSRSFTAKTASTVSQNQSSSTVCECPSDDDGRSVRSDTGTIIYRGTSPHPPSISDASQEDKESASLSDDAPIPAGDPDVDGNTAAALILPTGNLSGLWMDSKQVFELNPVPLLASFLVFRVALPAEAKSSSHIAGRDGVLGAFHPVPSA
jgi:hypothetical protein